MATVLTFQKPKIWVFVWEITDSEICHFKITAWLFFEMFCFVSTSWRNVSSTNKIVWNVFFDYSKSAKPYWNLITTSKFDAVSKITLYRMNFWTFFMVLNSSIWNFFWYEFSIFLEKFASSNFNWEFLELLTLWYKLPSTSMVS